MPTDTDAWQLGPPGTIGTSVMEPFYYQAGCARQHDPFLFFGMNFIYLSLAFTLLVFDCLKKDI